MRITSYFSIILFISLAILQSCTQSHTHSATDKKYAFALHLQAGQKYYIASSNFTATVISVNGKDLKNENKLFAGLIYEVVKDSAQLFTIKITYDSLHSYIKNNGEENEIDAANVVTTLNPVEKLLGVIKGKTVFININSKGQVVAVNGVKELTAMVVAGIGSNDANTNKQVQEQLNKILGEDVVRANVASVAALFPDSAVYAGDSWIKSSNETNVLGLKVLTNYTLDKMDDDIAVVKGTSEVNVSDTTVSLMGYDVSVNLKGEGDKNFSLNTSTGVLVNSAENTSINGTVELMGKQVPLTIRSKREVSVRKL